MIIDNMQKAQQGAAMLVSDLRECLKTCTPLESLLILPRIEITANLNFALIDILTSMKVEENGFPF